MIDAEFNSQRVARIQAEGSGVGTTRGSGQGVLPLLRVWTTGASAVSGPGGPGLTHVRCHFRCMDPFAHEVLVPVDARPSAHSKGL